MKTLTKLALVSAMAFSANAMAAQLQSLDDAELSAATGQDGISITIAGDIVADMIIHDKDGAAAIGSAVTGITNSGAGALVLDGFAVRDTSANVSAPKSGITLNIDSDSNGGAPVLNIQAVLPKQLTISTGTIYVAESGGVDADVANQYVDTTKAKILENIDIVLGEAKMNIQLGNAPQGAFIALDGAITGGLTLSNFSILAPTVTAAPVAGTARADITDRGIHMSSISVKSTGTNDLTLNGTKINIVDQGLTIHGMANIDVRIKDLAIGSKAGAAAQGPYPQVNAAASIGDIALLDLTVPTLVVRGH